jgi:hypothetical protein
MSDKHAVVLMTVRVKDTMQAKKALENLESNYLLDNSNNLCWSLIAEPEDSKQQTMPNDSIIWQYIENEIENLNQKYSSNGEKIFSAFRRERVYYEKDKIYIGEERKRGAIMDFSRYILGETDRNLFLSTNQELYNSHIDFMCVLDFDTRITRNAVSGLLITHKSLMESNSIVIKDKNVVSGYGIVQPRIQVLKKDDLAFEDKTLLQDNEKHYENSKAGTFYGKGLIHIPTFVTCLNNRLPKNIVLSHDFVEGEILRTYDANDVYFLESPPSSLKQLLARDNRWTRGNTQNLVFLLDKSFPKAGKIKLVKNAMKNVMKTMVPRTIDLQTLELFPIRLSNNVIAVSQSLIRMLITKKNLLLWTPYSNYEKIQDLNNDNYSSDELQGKQR